MLKLKNYQLVDVFEFLEKAELKPKASRVRTKLNRLFYAKIQELQSDELALLDKFGKKDVDGKLVETDGTFSLNEATAAEYHAEKRELLNEEISVNIDELHDKIGLLIAELENSDMKISGKDGVTFDFLSDILESEIKEGGSL